MTADGEYRVLWQLAIRLGEDIDTVLDWPYRKICGYAASLELDVEDEIAANNKAKAEADRKSAGKKQVTMR